MDHSFRIIQIDRPENSSAVFRSLTETPPGTGIICVTSSPEVCSYFKRKNICCIGLASDEGETFPDAYAVMILPGFDREWVILQGCHYYGLPYTVHEGNGLRIRESTPEDASILLPGLRNEGISVSAQDWEAYTQNAYRIQGYGMWTVEKEVSSWQNKTGSSVYTAAGWCGLHPCELPEGGVELGYYILPRFRRQGIAEDACRIICAYASSALGAETLQLRIRKENLSSRHLAGKLMFAEKGETDREILYAREL